MRRKERRRRDGKEGGSKKVMSMSAGHCHSLCVPVSSLSRALFAEAIPERRTGDPRTFVYLGRRRISVKFVYGTRCTTLFRRCFRLVRGITYRTFQHMLLAAFQAWLFQRFPIIVG